MAIFVSGPARTEGWDLGAPNIEGNQWDAFDESPIVISASSTRIVVLTSNQQTIIAEGTFTIKSGIVGLTANEAVDLGFASGIVTNFTAGWMRDGIFVAEAVITQLNKPFQSIAISMEYDKMLGLFSGNDEIYGNNFPQLDSNNMPTFERDDAGFLYNGNHLHGFDGNDKIFGGALIDSLWGDTGNDSIWGFAGDDIISGGAGNDNLYGGDGNDKINGGSGNDSLYGGLGNDTLYGLSGRDSFIFNSALNAASNVDTIKDFVIGTDKIVLDRLIFTAFSGKTSVGSTLLNGNNQYSVVSDTSMLDSNNSYLTYVLSNDTLYYDADGRGAGDTPFVIIELTGVSAPKTSDFQFI